MRLRVSGDRPTAGRVGASLAVLAAWQALSFTQAGRGAAHAGGQVQGGTGPGAAAGQGAPPDPLPRSNLDRMLAPARAPDAGDGQDAGQPAAVPGWDGVVA